MSLINQQKMNLTFTEAFEKLGYQVQEDLDGIANKLFFSQKENQLMSHFSKVISNRIHDGGVMHVERSFAKGTVDSQVKQVLLDLLYIEIYIGSIKRMYVRHREMVDGALGQLFISIRLENNIIIHYGMVKSLNASLRLDFSSSGYNIEYDSGINEPVLLNGSNYKEEDKWLQLNLTKDQKEQLQHLIELFQASLSVEGGQQFENRYD